MSHFGEDAKTEMNSEDVGGNPPLGLDQEDVIDEVDSQSKTPFSARRNPRICISKDLARKLARLGIPDDPASIGRAVNEIADRAISLGTGWLPNLSDAMAIQKGIADRLEEITVTNIALARILTDLEGAAEYKTILQSFKRIAQDKKAKR